MVGILWACGAFGFDNVDNRDCKPRLISFIEKCDATGCRVQMPDGTYGHGKLPLEWAKVSEVCQ
jgi:hypothetical protein